MNQDQYDQLTSPATPSVLSIENLMDKTPRTLVYGYTLERQTFHAYIGRDGELYILKYREAFVRGRELGQVGPFLMVACQSQRFIGGNDEFVPSKRAYPASCDFEFARLLESAGHPLNFTTFEPDAAEARLKQFSPYAGPTHDDVRMLNCEDVAGAVKDMMHSSLGDPYDEGTPQMPNLALRIAHQAILQQNAHADVDYTYGTAYVAADAIFPVRATARGLIEQLVASRADRHSHLEEVIYAVLGLDEFANEQYAMHSYAGVVTVGYDGNLAQWLKHIESLHVTVFDGPAGRIAVRGAYAGHPFLVKVWNPKKDEESVRIELQYAQFGDSEEHFARSLTDFVARPATA